MGRRGPAPKPSRLKELEGNPGKRRLNKDEPKPAAGRPACPAWLADEAKKKWRALVPELERLGLLTVVDGDALAVYCEAWASFRKSCETLAEDGETFTTDKGYVGPHPAIAIRNAARQTIKSFASLFGLDPSSRSRLKGSGGGKEKSETKPDGKARFFRTVG